MSNGPYWSVRFGCRVWLTDHALSRAAERRIPLDTLLELIETGTMRERESGHCWIWKDVAGRQDNLLCIAARLADALVVKTVMHHFDPEAE